MARDRARMHPALPLRVALTRLAEFEARFGLTPAPAEKAREAWNLAGHALTGRIVAALGYYGLLARSNAAVDGASQRRLAVTEAGRRCLHCEDDSDRRSLIQKAALSPIPFAKYRQLWGTVRPQEFTPQYAAALNQLITDDGFGPTSAALFINTFYDTIEFAGLVDGNDRLTENVGKMAEFDATNSAGVREDALVAGLGHNKLRNGELAKGDDRLQYERFSLDEGDVVVAYPSQLTPDGFENLKDYLNLFLRKIHRRMGLPPVAAAAR